MDEAGEKDIWGKLPIDGQMHECRINTMIWARWDEVERTDVPAEWRECDKWSFSDKWYIFGQDVPDDLHHAVVAITDLSDGRFIEAPMPPICYN